MAGCDDDKMIIILIEGIEAIVQCKRQVYACRYKKHHCQRKDTSYS